MKKINKIIGLIGLLVFFGGCEKDDPSIGEIIAPSNIVVTSEIVGQDADNPYGDGTGVINFTVKANNAIGYKLVTSGGQQVSPSGKASITFTTIGVNNYQVTVVAIGTGGVTSSVVAEVEVLVTYSPPADLLQILVGDGSKTWRIKSEKKGHFGLGPINGDIPSEYFGVQPEEKVGVGMYDDRYIFNSDGTFTHITDNTNDDPVYNPEGTVFGREILINELGGVGGGEQNGTDVLNYPLNDYTENWGLIAPGGIETITLTGNGFMGYYTGGNHQYRIFDRSVSNELMITTNDGNGEFTWWFIITSQEPGEEDDVTSDFNTLIWEDNFDTDGAPDPTKWTYDLGKGSSGWGNNESQSYTDSPDNVIIEDGVLKITARAENGGYTSARIKTEGLFGFTYGRVEVRAKLPTGGGTWPAIWMLGQNYKTDPWPASGEIDIMEHVGNSQNTIFSTLHLPENYGGNGITASITEPTASTEFHLYSVEWSSTTIKFMIDNKVFHTYENTPDTPFNADFFLILNFAMGGNFGGTIDPAFTESTFEIDYVKVYQ